jgi:hypothetical protein
MSADHDAPPDPDPDRARRDSLLSDYLHFLKRTRKWWLTPLLFLLFLLTLLFVLAITGATTFRYTLF